MPVLDERQRAVAERMADFEAFRFLDEVPQPSSPRGEIFGGVLARGGFYDKSQPRDKKGRFGRKTGDGFEVDASPSGDVVRTALDKIPQGVRLKMVDKGLTVKATKQNLGMACGQYDWNVRHLDLDLESVGQHPDDPAGDKHREFVALHEMGHAFDHLFSSSPDRGIESSISATDEWASVVRRSYRAEHRDIDEYDTHNKEMFADVFALAMGAPPTEDWEMFPPPKALLAWVRAKVKRVENAPVD
jgi:hypothetical protein